MSLSLSQDILAIFDDFVDAHIYERSRDCIKILKPDGTISRINPGGTLALELDRAGQLDGTAWTALWPDGEHTRVEQALDDARHNRPSQFLIFGPTLKQAPRWWDVLLTPMSGEPPNVRRLLVVARDVTELIEARELLAQASTRRIDAMKMLSHELRNPLSALSMAATTLQSGAADPCVNAKLGQMMARQVGHMSRLVEDLIDGSDIGRAHISLQPEYLDLRDVIRDAHEQLAHVLAERRQRLNMALPTWPVPFAGDRTRLTQVFANLLANATRYSPWGGLIEVSLTLGGGHATVTVADQGQGFTSAMLPRLFDMYWKGQETPEQHLTGGSLGLGLAIVKAMVEIHGGTVKAASAGSGMGSVFTVQLPLGAA
jgi:signal transduction histidine kinase